MIPLHDVPASIPALMLAITRVGSCLALSPAFGMSLPTRIRFALVVGLAAVMIPRVAIPEGVGVPALILVETVVGLGMGMALRLALLAVELCAEIVGLQMGLGFAQMVDPASGEQSTVLRRIVMWLAAVLLFATGLYRELILALAHSYDVLPAGSAWSLEAFLSLVPLVSGAFLAGLVLSTPMVAATLAVQLSFGFMARLSPQLNVWSVGFLASVGTGLVVLAVHAPVLVHETQVALERGLDLALAGP